jgi:eukaryotic-like serine/threonine-protein kinase
VLEEVTVETRPFVRASLGAQPPMLGPYRLYERLGAGGLASVYRARRVGDPEARDVAVKRLHPHLAHSPGAIASFAKEMHLSCLLDHPLIRRIHALCRERDEIFMVMDYVAGRSLAAVLKRAYATKRRLPLRAVLAVLHRGCAALHHAHELVDEHGEPAGFVHRDISPSNLMVSPSGRLTLIDMGVARARLGDAPTRAGLIKGKLGYMAPEILAGQPYDRRADVFSIGVVAWEMLTLSKLYPIRNRLEDLERVRARPIVRPSAVDVSCPPELDDIVLRALATAPEDRWPSCRAMAHAVQDLAARLHQPLSDSEIAELAGDLDAPPAVRDLPLPLPAPRRRLARGTASDHDDEPSTAPAPAPPPPEPRRTVGARGGFALGTVFGSLLTLLAVSAIDLYAPSLPVVPRQLAPVDAGAADTGAADDAAPVDAGVADAPAPDVEAAAIDAAPPADVAADAGPDEVDAADVTRTGGPWPGSRTSSYPYRARLCIDAGGEVTSAEVLDGPERLKSRIEWALRRWRYAPYRRAGRAHPVCFEIESEVRKKSRPR